MEVQIHGNRK